MIARAGRLALFALALWAGRGVLAACTPVDDDRVTDELVIELVPGTPIAPVAARHPITVLDSIEDVDLYRAIVNVGANVDQVVSELESDPDVRSAEPHRHLETAEGVKRTIPEMDVTANSTTFLNQTLAGIIHTASAHTRYNGDGVTVAVLDTAESVSNPETSTSMWGPGLDLVGGAGTADVSANGIDDDADGLVDESDQHGTHVAGLVHLAAPGAKILAIRILEEDGKGESFTIAKGILRAIRAGAKVINLSFSMQHDSRVIARALEDAADAGVLVVAAAGNSGLECVEFPAYRPDVLAVASVDNTLAKSDFASYGAEIDLSAPGRDALSTFGGAAWARWTGSSFSAPLVAGGAALLFEKYPGLTPAQAMDVLMMTTQPDANPPSLAGLMGAGVLDLDGIASALTTDRSSLKTRKDPAGTVLRWSPVLGATRYDVARGDLANVSLTAGQVALGPLTCITNDTTSTDSAAAADPTLPVPGQVFFYVFRDDAPDVGGSSYGAGTNHGPRVPGASDCPL
jgi:subtilisin family serine protease